jgi:P4 family phage/plasmid primase-like protien
VSAEAVSRPPYATVASQYQRAGWSPIPLPYEEKWPPPDGYTGEHGKYAGREDVAAWSRGTRPRRARAGNLSYPPGNVAIRLPENVIGLDVDAYGEKQGRAAIEEGEKRWGKLPDTWMSSSRSDGSGIRLYRVPTGLAWPGDLRRAAGHGGVELIRCDHRYAIVFPSVHDKTKEVYRWWNGPGGLPDGAEWKPGDDDDGWEFPAPEELPELPPAWIEGLTEGKEKGNSAEAEALSSGEVREWLLDCNGADRAMCSEMRKTLNRTLRAIRIAGDDGGAHEAARDGAWAIIGDAAGGHTGVIKALAKVKSAFFKAVEERRDGRIARGEWARIINRGVAKVAAEGEPETEDICDLLGDGDSGGGTDRRRVRASDSDDGISIAGRGSDSGDSSGGVGKGIPAHGGKGPREGKAARGKKAGREGETSRSSSAFDYTRDDIGNAQRLVHARRHDMRFVPSVPSWCTWSEGEKRWVFDQDGQAERWAIQVVRGMEEEAKFIEDLKQRAAFLSFVRASGNVGKLRAMVSLAASLKGMSVKEETFDANPYLVGCKNGAIDLRGDGLPDGPKASGGWKGVKLRPSVPEHYLTMTTGVKFNPEARSKLWDNFIESAQPDPEAREWLQKLVGYSLMGLNPERLFVAVYGPTSTGKSTFLEIIRLALGGYADSFNLSMLRDSQDERPRADLVGALPKRFIYAEEASTEWHLHPDQIKRITGGTPISARRPFAKANVSMLPAFTPWMATNAAPSIGGSDLALKRRMIVVPFISQVAQGKESTGLAQRVIRSAPDAVLAWAVKGWENYIRSGGLHNAPVSTWKAKQEFQEEMSDSEAMLNEVCDIDDRYRELPNRVYQAYLVWCEKNNTSARDQLSQVKLGRWLASQGYELRVAKNEEGKPTRYRYGLRLKKEWAAVVGVDG